MQSRRAGTLDHAELRFIRVGETVQARCPNSPLSRRKFDAMPQSLTIPPEARCLGCGYLLQGLPAHTCPECGRKFDPADPTTFDTRPPHWQRRRWIKRGLWAAGVGLVYMAIGPRAVRTGSLAFTCAVCGEKVTFYRFESIPPSWIPPRYPAFRWTTRTPPPDRAAATTCTGHFFGQIRVRFDLYFGGWVSGNYIRSPTETPTLNGQLTTPDTARDVLRNLMSPNNNGIGP